MITAISFSHQHDTRSPGAIGQSSYILLHISKQVFEFCLLTHWYSADRLPDCWGTTCINVVRDSVSTTYFTLVSKYVCKFDQQLKKLFLLLSPKIARTLHHLA